MSRQARIAADQGMLTVRNCGGLYKLKKSCWVTQKDKHVISNSSFFDLFLLLLLSTLPPRGALGDK